MWNSLYSVIANTLRYTRYHSFRAHSLRFFMKFNFYASCAFLPIEEDSTGYKMLHFRSIAKNLKNKTKCIRYEMTVHFFGSRNMFKYDHNNVAVTYTLPSFVFLYNNVSVTNDWYADKILSQFFFVDPNSFGLNFDWIEFKHFLFNFAKGQNSFALEPN